MLFRSRVLIFQPPILLHHRGVGRQVSQCFIHRFFRRIRQKCGPDVGRLAELIDVDEVLCPSVFTMGARLTRTILPRRVEPGEKPGYDFAMGYCAEMATLAFKLFHSREQQEQGCSYVE